MSRAGATVIAALVMASGIASSARSPLAGPPRPLQAAAVSVVSAAGDPMTAPTPASSSTSTPAAEPVTMTGREPVPKPVTTAGREPVTLPAPVPVPVAIPSVVVLGDSVPAGTACRCAAFGVVVASQVHGALISEAVPGLTTGGLLDQIRTPAVAAALRSADIVTVTIGANDLDESLATNPACLHLACYGSEVQRVTGQIAAITRVIAHLVPSGATVIVTGYWNVFLDGTVATKHGRVYVAISKALTLRINAILFGAATAHAFAYADLYATFKGDGTRDDTTLLAADGNHPSSAGHELIAATLAADLPTQLQHVAGRDWAHFDRQ